MGQRGGPVRGESGRNALLEDGWVGANLVLARAKPSMKASAFVFIAPRAPACLSSFHTLTSIAGRTGSPRHASTRKFWVYTCFFPLCGRPGRRLRLL